MASDLGIIEYGHTTRPSSLLNSIFMYTVNTAAKTLVSVAEISKVQNTDRWKTRDHLRFMVMLMTWLTVWVLRVLMDHLPIISTTHGFPFSSHSLPSLNSLAPLTSSSSSSSLLGASTSSSLDLLLYDGVDGDGPSVKALGRALTQILAILNEIPATSRKYQFAMTMADRIMEQNARDEHVELLEVNQTALSSAFTRTSNLLYNSLQSSQSQDDAGAWAAQAISALPLGSYVAPYVKGLSFCFNTVLSWVETGTSRLQGRGEVVGVVGLNSGEHGEVMAEKLGQELLWITDKLRVYGGGNEALMQWSYCSGLASLSLNASPRVQGLILKISAILFRDLSRKSKEVGRQVKYRLLLLWLPLFCHANNGLSYPVLTSNEKLEIELSINDMISTLPASDQEVVLSNWIQNFAVCSSDWPNLQLSYDRWCHSARQLVT